MNGELERPLGLPKTTSGKPVQRLPLVLYAVLGLMMVGVGFAAKGLLDKQSEDPLPKVRQTTQQRASDNDNAKVEPTPIVEKIAKRPDLPIDQDGPGLSELAGSGQLLTPGSIPKKRPSNDRKNQSLAHLPDPELVKKSSYGLLPVMSPDGLRPFDLYSRQPDTEGNFGVARIVIIVGGLGISQTSTEQAIRLLPAGVTLAFAPYGNSLSRWMQMARKGGHELLIQVPMEPFGYPQISAGDHSLLSGADDEKNKANLLWTLGRITNYVGIMNYMGGKMLTSGNQLGAVFEELAERGLMFVDDGSIRNSMAASAAKSAGVPFTSSHLTIDSLRQRSAIGKRLKELESMAKRTGLAIGVATAFPDTISQIVKFLKNAKSRGLELTPVSAIATEHKG